ncbi:MAG: IclR family transcriptional regulator [Defluviicoccus sp.]|nr:IclR family transcriptional regulator [Defluviicoccus sp.]
MAAEGESRPGIGSVETAAAILGALAEGGGQMPLGALAVAAGMHRAKVHRYLISLTRSGLVAQPERNGAYSIGPLAISIGLAGLRRVDPIRVAYEALPELRDRVDETVFLAIWGDMGVTCIGLEESAHPVTLNIRVGSVLPFLSTAAGQVFAAYMPRARVDRFAKMDAARSRHRPAAALDLSGQRRDSLLREVRERRLARVRGALFAGVNAMAAPIFDHRGELSTVVGVMGRQETLDVAWDGAAAAALSEFADRLSRRLGHAGDGGQDKPVAD